MSIDIKNLTPLDGVINPSSGKGPLQKAPTGPSFEETLKNLQKGSAQNRSEAKVNTGLKFSNHAIDRMRSRGVSFTPDQLAKLEAAVDKAAQKGGRDSLVLMNDTAVIVSVKNNTVVTVVDKSSLKENVFTNIDSTIVI